MKQFFKTMGYGLIHLFLAAISIALIAVSFYGFIVELPTAIGIVAVGIFINALCQLALSGVIIYALGFNMAKVKGEEKDVT